MSTETTSLLAACRQQGPSRDRTTPIAGSGLDPLILHLAGGRGPRLIDLVGLDAGLAV